MTHQTALEMKMYRKNLSKDNGFLSSVSFYIHWSRQIG